MSEDHHIHVHIESDFNRYVFDRLTSMEETMSAQSEALAGLTASVSALVARVEEDVTALRDKLAAAEANDAADTAMIAELRADADAAVASINEAKAVLDAVDPDPANPVVEDATPTA